MKILCVGDLHCKANGISRFNACMDSINNILSTQDVDIVWLSGDVFDRHAEVNLYCMAAVKAAVTKLALKHKVTVSVGNHDMPNNDPDVDSPDALMCLDGINGVVIARKAFEYSNCLFVPYMHPAKFAETLDSQYPGWRTVKVIFGHQEIYGCQLGAAVSAHGTKYANDWPTLISGHIHDKRLLQENVYYVGTPVMQTFGETEDKSVCIYDSELGQITHVIDTNLPKKLTIGINVSELDSLTLNDRDEYRIKITGTQAENASKRNHNALKHSGVKQVIWEQTDKPVVKQETVATFQEKMSELVKMESQIVISSFSEICR
jgi:DNA repair exonuclease SbcCD nuclease subunit